METYTIVAFYNEITGPNGNIVETVDGETLEQALRAFYEEYNSPHPEIVAILLGNFKRQVIDQKTYDHLLPF